MKKHHWPIAAMGATLLLGVGTCQLSSCGGTSAAAAEPAPLDVEVATVEQKDIPVYRMDWDSGRSGQRRYSRPSHWLPLDTELFRGLLRQKRAVTFSNRSPATSSGGGPGKGTVGAGDRTASASAGTISTVRGATGERRGEPAQSAI